MRTAITDLSEDERRQLIGWIGERPETAIAVAALRSGVGRLCLDGEPAAPSAALIESALVPGEPQGFGEGDALLGLLAATDGWHCVEVSDDLAREIEGQFAHRWGTAPSVVDVVHELTEPATAYEHPLVRQLTPAEALELPTEDDDLLPDRRLVAASAENGHFFAAIDDGVIIGQGGSLATGFVFADIGIHVAGARRRQGLATACASRACRAVQNDGLTPVWGTSSDNAASLAVARKLGFVETARLRFLVRGDR